ncbi:MAG: hypothetical protein IJ558_01765 [Treponema sp.]|nr:hypothetical protein [Treponema sp.]
MPLTEKQKHNYAYYQLVNDENDLIGMIGYSLYKKAKIDYIEKYYAENKEYPDDNQLQDFQFQQCGETIISSHKKVAEQLMNTFMSKYIEEYGKDLLEKTKNLELKIDETNKRQDVLKDKEVKIKQKEKDFKKDKRLFELKKAKSFWTGVLQSLIASMVLTIISVIVLLQMNIPSSFIDMLVIRLQQK